VRKVIPPPSALIPLLFLASAAFAAERPLREVLYAMPKGGDLHNHLTGAVYAETFLEFARRDGLCVDTQELAIVDCPAAPVDEIVPAANTATDSNLYWAMLDALSMRQFRATNESGHDHFFATFGKFGAVSHRHIPEMVTDVVSRFAAENVDYVETMFAPDQGARAEVAQLISGTTPREMYDSIMKNPDNAKVLDQVVATARKTLDDVDATMRTTLRCETPDAKPGCESTWRCIYELYRGTPREAFFASLLVGYQLASVDPRVVGLNPVMPEDAYLPMTQFDEQMRMFEFLHTVYPKVHLTTHAGELTLGLVPIEGLRHHIRDSVVIAGAERIGHGVDIAYERDASDLMKTMATRGVAVEICLTSNDVILGVRGRQHPLRLYLDHGVPVALATDDPGVSRDDMTNQYVRAVEDQGLRYEQLKQMARNSLEYAFVEGESLWTSRRFVAINAACATEPKSERCTAFLAKNTKARLQWRLEQRLRAFEASYGDSLPR
jgi:adenosine deaminase